MTEQTLLKLKNSKGLSTPWRKIPASPDAGPAQSNGSWLGSRKPASAAWTGALGMVGASAGLDRGAAHRFDTNGIATAQEDVTRYVCWHAITEVRENRQVVVFMRGVAMISMLPASVFRSVGASR